MNMNPNGQSRLVPIIAVFGGDKHQCLAQTLGEGVARSGAILLTGGTCSCGERGKQPVVKEAAIAGAERVGGRWIGVARARPGKNPAPWSLGHVNSDARVIHCYIDHKRNYLEACVCDAAIAIESNGEGTVSEAAFCLSRGKPVVFVGERWRSDFAVDNIIDVGRLVDACLSCMSKSDDVSSPFDSELTETQLRSTLAERLQAGLSFADFDADSEHAADIVKKAMEMAYLQGIYPINEKSLPLDAGFDGLNATLQDLGEWVKQVSGDAR